MTCLTFFLQRGIGTNTVHCSSAAGYVLCPSYTLSESIAGNIYCVFNSVTCTSYRKCQHCLRSCQACQFELLNSQNLHKYVNIQEKFKFTKSVRPIRANRSKAILYFNLNRQHETPVPTFAHVCHDYLPCSYLHKVFYISGLGHISWCALRLIRKKISLITICIHLWHF